MRPRAERGVTISQEPSAARRRLKVVRLIPVLDFGGVETTFLLEAESVDRTSFDFSICTFWNDGRMAAQIRETGTRVTTLDIDPSIRNPAATAALARFLRRERPDILHASIGEANFHAALVGRLCGVPVTIIEEQGLPSRTLVGRAVHALLYRRVDAVIGVSQASCAYLTDQEWAPKSRVHLLYNAAAHRFFYTPLAPRPARDTFEFLAVGRLVEVKNHARLLRAFRLVADRLDRVRLRIVGEGPLRPELEALVAELDLGAQVTLAGFSADVLGLLDEGDAFVLPSLSEGFGIAAVEAMARGLPPIVSDTGALGEVTAGLGDQWTVPATDIAGWADAMIRMATLPPAEMTQLRSTARHVAERFSQSRHIKALQSLYLGLYRGAVRHSA
jgi:glycosyltransferase involved in cell wall biosynthesis